jgi:hypothetical protein
MNSDSSDFAGRVGPEDQEDQPLLILAEQERETSPDFVEKVKRRIHRRTVAAQYASLSWHLPKEVMVEMAGVFRHLITEIGGRKGHRS